MSKVKVTYANGVVHTLDTEVEATPTGYGDEHGVTHAVVSVEPAADDAETGFSGGAAPAADEPVSVTTPDPGAAAEAPAEDGKDAEIQRLKAELAAAQQSAAAG